MSKRIERKVDVMKYIQEKIYADGFPPSIREIGLVCGISSTSVVYSILAELADENKITFQKNKKRALALVKPDLSTVARVPVVGRVTAGIPILAQENIENYVSYCTNKDPEQLFALNVMGTSMIGAGIMDGDIVIVEKTPVAENGEIVVAMIDSEATVKRFYKESDQIRLQPENPDMKPIYTKNVVILGKVVACIRHYS